MVLKNALKGYFDIISKQDRKSDYKMRNPVKSVQIPPSEIMEMEKFLIGVYLYGIIK